MFLKTFTVDVASVHTNIVLVKIPEHSDVNAEQVVQRLAQVCLAETQVSAGTSDNWNSGCDVFILTDEKCRRSDNTFAFKLLQTLYHLRINIQIVANPIET